MSAGTRGALATGEVHPEVEPEGWMQSQETKNKTLRPDDLLGCPGYNRARSPNTLADISQ